MHSGERPQGDREHENAHERHLAPGRPDPAEQFGQQGEDRRAECQSDRVDRPQFGPQRLRPEHVYSEEERHSHRNETSTTQQAPEHWKSD